jgi:Resolvase, N terminal domain
MARISLRLGLRDLAESRSWSLVAADGSIDTSTPHGRAMTTVMSAFAEMERDLISTRTREGLAAKKAAGVRLGRPSELPAAVREWVSLGLGCLVVCCSGCSSSKPRVNSSTAPAGEGSVTGMLQLVGGAEPGTDNPASGEVYAFNSASLTGTPIAKAKTASNGSFRLSLPPGTYYLAATSPSFSIDPPPATPPCRADKPAVVSPGIASRVDVACHMK